MNQNDKNYQLLVKILHLQQEMIRNKAKHQRNDVNAITKAILLSVLGCALAAVLIFAKDPMKVGTILIAIIFFSGLMKAIWILIRRM